MRYFLKQQASRLKINGSVFYLEDNSVVVMAIGKQPGMDEFITIYHQGNRDSIIKNVRVKQIPLLDTASFEVVDVVHRP
nr:acylphosphatase [Bacteroidota bacterium]